MNDYEEVLTEVLSGRFPASERRKSFSRTFGIFEFHFPSPCITRPSSVR
jgi:hypothetical protein